VCLSFSHASRKYPQANVRFQPLTGTRVPWFCSKWSLTVWSWLTVCTAVESAICFNVPAGFATASSQVWGPPSLLPVGFGRFVRGFSGRCDKQAYDLHGVVRSSAQAHICFYYPIWHASLLFKISGCAQVCINSSGRQSLSIQNAADDKESTPETTEWTAVCFTWALLLIRNAKAGSVTKTFNIRQNTFLAQVCTSYVD
jgi:hypothetical protein